MSRVSYTVLLSYGPEGETVEQIIRGKGLFSYYSLHGLDIFTNGITGILELVRHISMVFPGHPFTDGRLHQTRQRARLASSFLASAGVCPLLFLLSARAVLLLAPVLGRHLGMVIDLGVSMPERFSRDPAGTFVSQSAAQLHRPGILVPNPC
ncbi:hypothetical protein GOODEAATRI_024627 [Goodea atripinnis]|uniref:Uncharacterized protein n=1 Tax=Goodea atripinnis TaxID=208336 RepID=A0ABV0MKT8_9TELE